MINLFKFRFKTLIRNKTLLFWNLMFPLALTTFFAMALPTAYETVTFDSIPVAIIETKEYKSDESFQSTLTAIADMETPLLKPVYTTVDEADRLLAEGEVDGIIEKTDTFHVYVASTGINQTILQSFMDEYIQKTSMIETMMKNGAGFEKIMESMDETTSFIKEDSKDNTDLSSVYFYTIIAMCCLYGGFMAMNSVRDIQANLSPVAARNSLAPIHKSKLLFVNFVMDCIFGYGILMIMLSYMIFVLHVQFAYTFPYILLLIAMGVITGNSIGTLIGVSSSKSNDTKTSILSSITLFLCFLSGMMIVEMKYFVATYLPFLAAVNPATMITDALYSLYYYGPGDRYMINLISLLIFSVIAYIISFFVLRRKQYASL